MFLIDPFKLEAVVLLVIGVASADGRMDSKVGTDHMAMAEERSRVPMVLWVPQVGLH